MLVNEWHGIGNLGADPMLRETTSGKKCCTFNIAVDRRFRLNGELKKITDWIPIVCWDRTAESCATSLRKGARVIVSGPLCHRSYVDENGNKQQRWEVSASEVVFMDRQHSPEVVENTTTEMP